MSDKDVRVVEGTLVAGKVTSMQSHVSKSRHPDIWPFVQKRMIKQVALQEEYKLGMARLVNAEIELRETEEKWRHLDKILESVEIQHTDQIEKDRATIVANRFHRDTMIKDAELQNIEKAEQLAKAKARNGKPGEDDTSEYWEKKKSKILEKDEQEAEIASELRQKRRKRIKNIREDMYEAVDDYVADVNRRYGRELDLSNRESWREEDQDNVRQIEYEFEQMIEDM